MGRDDSDDDGKAGSEEGNEDMDWEEGEVLRGPARAKTELEIPEIHPSLRDWDVSHFSVWVGGKTNRSTLSGELCLGSTH